VTAPAVVRGAAERTVPGHVHAEQLNGAITPPESKLSPPVVHSVAMGQSGIAHRGELLRTAGLGSCVAIVIIAPAQRLAVLAHCILPTRDDPSQPAARYIDTAVPALLALLRDAGACAPLAAVLVGGASMFPGLDGQSSRDIAGDNIRAARQALANAAIPLRSEALGGTVGRSVVVDPTTQRVLVHTIRSGDRYL